MRATLPLLALFILSACASTGIPRIGMGDFTALDVNGAPVTGGKPLTLRLDKDGQASGHGGCNSFSTRFELASGERISFGPIASTRMACEPAVMEQESRYFAILDAAESYSVYGSGSVSIIAPDGRAIRFRR
ncbi:META domain-containing protein [Sphingosinicella sp. BN140058]|uniref:META domain-containing protein n=1 Tax=Sphingosinicella sp. BN140058 TaxID=1892855 RepID=UPI00101090AD|nr:META domain-containing protein [Sphingosinicella sp. BN140058]QAY76857.1 META domain-containing protein [Sphingosinicella sp. BN140058]